MKALPPYLEKIVDFMAESEEKTGGMKKQAAVVIFRDDLIKESLTAKANPSPGRKTVVTDDNPTVKPFHEIYGIAGDNFKDSPLGRALGGFSGSTKTSGERGMGRKFFEDMRNFATNTADEVIKGVFGKQLKRFNPGMKMPAGNILENGSGEYPRKGLEGLSLGERNEIQMQTEQMRYIKLLVSSLIFGLIEPIFQMSKQDLLGLLETLLPVPEDPKNLKKVLQSLSTPQFRSDFIANILQLMKDRDGIITASLKVSDYEGKDIVGAGGARIKSTVMSQLAELEKIREQGGKVSVVPPEAFIPM